MPRVCGGILMSVDRRFFPKEGVIHQGDLRVRVRVTRFFPNEGFIHQGDLRVRVRVT
jgi:hypothetical protein